MKKGFTLIELAIVLVVIGLLIGGILVAKSMILTTKITRLVTDIGRYEIAINTFYVNYKSTPGDSIYFAPPGNGNDAFNGNGPGNCAVAPNTTLSNQETFQFWGHLSQAHMLDKTYLSWSPTYCGGTQGGDYSASYLAGVVWPYTEANVSGESNKSKILAGKNAGKNLSLMFFVSTDYVIAMESKMNGKSDDGTQLQTGLTNQSGKGLCQDIDGYTIACNSPDATLGTLYYYIAPQ